MTTAPDSDAIPLPCPRCGYDLRGNSAGVCPECGEAFDAAALTTAAIPWQSRREIGRFRAFRRTVWLAVRRPKELAAQASRPVDYADARRFQIVCVTLAWLTFTPLAAIGMWIALRQVAAAGLTGPDTWAGWLADGAIVLAAAVGLFLWLLTASGVASYFFHPRQLPVELQDRAVALSYYTAAPLAFAPAVAAGAIVIAALAFAGESLVGTSRSSPLDAPLRIAVLLVSLATGGLAILVGLNLFVLPAALLSRGLHASAGRVALCVAVLLVAWPLLLLVFAAGTPLVVFYAEMAWHALGGGVPVVSGRPSL